MEFEKFMAEKNCPIIFNNMISHWPAIEWNPHSLSDILKERIIRCKIGPKFQGGFFETDCLYLDVMLSDFVDWCEGCDQTENPLSKVDRDKYFCYVDYKYMAELFEDSPDILTQCVDWSCFGLDNRDGKDSTIWIGSEGSSTPCHYDTYGFNLVAQIYGRKQWFLFPPSDSENMYDTRIPYEESSVYSEVNIKQPDTELHPKFEKCHPYIVTLKAGQVLYVPKHWWHYVECLETSVSINTWVDMVDDKNTRVEEATTRILLSSLVSNLENDVQMEQWINPNEELQTMSMNLSYLMKALSDLQEKSAKSTDNFQLFCNKFKTCCVFNRNYAVTTCDRKTNIVDESNLIHSITKRKRIKPSLSDLDFGDGHFSGISESASETDASSDRKINIIEESNLTHPTRKRIKPSLDNSDINVLTQTSNIDNNISSCDRIVIPLIDIQKIPKHRERVVHITQMDNLSSTNSSFCLEQIRYYPFHEYLKLLNAEQEILGQVVKSNDKSSKVSNNDSMARQFVKSVLSPKVIRQISDSLFNSSFK